MEILRIGSGSVAVCIYDGERVFEDGVTAEELHAIVDAAFRSAGISVRGSRTVKLFRGSGCVIIFAMKDPEPSYLFVFDGLEPLISACHECVSPPESSLAYCDGSYILCVKSRFDAAPAPFLEFGTPLENRPGSFEHICEHGKRLIDKNAVETIKNTF